MTTAPNVAEIVANVEAVTDWVLTVNVPDDCPDEMVTLEGTTTFVVDDRSWIVAPPAGAGETKLTVPAELLPPTTEVGKTETDCKAGMTIDKF